MTTKRGAWGVWFRSIDDHVRRGRWLRRGNNALRRFCTEAEAREAPASWYPIDVAVVIAIAKPIPRGTR